MKKVRPSYLVASCPWSWWRGWRGCFGSLCCRNLPEMPIWIPKAESQRAEATGCPLGYCQMLWLLGTLPGRQSSYHDNPPLHKPEDFFHFSFSIKYQGIPGTGKHSSQDRTSSAPGKEAGKWGVEMCLCYHPTNLHQYKCIRTYFWVKMCVFGCLSMHGSAGIIQMVNHCLSAHLLSCSPPLSPAPMLGESLQPQQRESAKSWLQLGFCLLSSISILTSASLSPAPGYL